MTVAAGLLNTPTDQQSFDIWAFQLFQNVSDINAAIFSQQNVNLPVYPIYPIPLNDLGTWLLNISEAVDNICSQLKIQSVDIENVGLNDDRERQSWAFSVFTEINQARIILKI